MLWGRTGWGGEEKKCKCGEPSWLRLQRHGIPASSKLNDGGHGLRNLQRCSVRKVRESEIGSAGVTFATRKFVKGKSSPDYITENVLANRDKGKRRDSPSTIPNVRLRTQHRRREIARNFRLQGKSLSLDLACMMEDALRPARRGGAFPLAAGLCWSL
jgi:hypothetical protein